MAERIERKCRDCFHYGACKAMLEAAGIGSFVGENSNAERCKDFVSSADVAPVVHGRWVEKQGGFWETATCSNCGEKYPTVGIIPRYCPNCGARMDKEDSECDT